MDFKKVGVYSVFALLLIPMFSVMVSAGLSEEVGSAVNAVYDIGKPIFSALFGNNATDGGSLVLQILVFLIVSAIIYGVMASIELFQGKEWINIVIALGVSIIGIRFMPSNFLMALATPSSAIIASIVIVIPFIVAFFIIEKFKKPTVRKILWVVFGLMLIMLWAYTISNPSVNEDVKKWMRLIYPIMTIVVLLVLAFDSRFQRWKMIQGSQKTLNAIDKRHLADLEERWTIAKNRLATDPINSAKKGAVTTAEKNYKAYLAQMQA